MQVQKQGTLVRLFGMIGVCHRGGNRRRARASNFYFCSGSDGGMGQRVSLSIGRCGVWTGGVSAVEACVAASTSSTSSARLVTLSKTM